MAHQTPPSWVNGGPPARNATNLNILSDNQRDHEARMVKQEANTLDGLTWPANGGDIDLVAGSNITITGNNTTKQISIQAAGGSATGMTTVNTVGLLNSVTGTSVGNVRLLLGYFAAGDFGEPIEFLDTNSGATVNGGTVHAHVAGGSRRWEMLGKDTAEMNVMWFGAKGDGSNDAAAIQAAELWAKDHGCVVFFPRGTPAGGFLYGSTLDIHDTNVTWRGENTVLKRTGDFLGIRIHGTPDAVGSSGRNLYPRLENLWLDGGNLSYTSDLVSAAGCSFLEANNVTFNRSGGRLLYAPELWDSRFNDCKFTNGGNTSGTLPMVELESGAAIPGDAFSRHYGLTNHVHFNGCHWEHFSGRALGLTGSGTDEIYVNHSKVEGGDFISPIRVANATNVRLDIQTTTQGSGAHTFPAHVEVDNSDVVEGTIWCEHITGGNPLTTVLDVVGSTAVSFEILGNVSMTSMAGAAAVVTDNQYSWTHSFRGAMPGSKIVYKSPSPTVSVSGATGAGTSPGTPSVDEADHTAGLVIIVTGTSPATNARVATVTFPDQVLRSKPVIILGAGNSAAGAKIWNIWADRANTDADSFQIWVGGDALAASTTYWIQYQIVGGY